MHKKININIALTYYLLVALVAYRCIDFYTLHSMRIIHLYGYSYPGTSPKYKVVLFDYLAHAKPGNAEYWGQLASNYALLGDYNDAVTAYRKAVRLMPHERPYQEGLRESVQMTKDRR